MRADARGLPVSAATFVLVLVPAQLLGQDAAPAVMLEPAIYADSGLRDPFDPLTVQSASDAGPRFETLRLTGVFLGSPGNSLAVLEDPSRRGHFLRVGEGIAGARLIQILPDAAVFEVEEYGTARREVLRLERSEEKP